MKNEVARNKTQETGFTQVPNEILNDGGLSWGAKGLWAYMAGKPEGWKFTIRLMARQCKDSIGKTTSRLNELLEAGYVEREIVMTKNGKKCFYSIYKKPNLEKPNLEKPNLEKPNLENPILEYSNKEISNKEIIDIPQNSKNQINNYKQTEGSRLNRSTMDDIPLEGDDKDALKSKVDESIKKEVNHEPNPPSAGDPPSQKKVDKKEIWEQEFEKIWQYCPNKRGKADGKKAYARARKNGVSKEVILEGMKKYAERVKLEKTPKQYIRQGGNWFKGERWEDEIDLQVEGSEVREVQKKDDGLLDFLNF